jgi:hypothetical protein
MDEGGQVWQCSLNAMHPANALTSHFHLLCAAVAEAVGPALTQLVLQTASCAILAPTEVMVGHAVRQVVEPEQGAHRATLGLPFCL